MSMSLTPDAVQNTVSEFVYHPDEGLTFSAYVRRYEQIFNQECIVWEDKRLLLRKIAQIEYEKYCNHIPPPPQKKTPGENVFEDTVHILMKPLVKELSV